MLIYFEVILTINDRIRRKADFFFLKITGEDCKNLIFHCLPDVRHVDGSEDLDLGEARDSWCAAGGTTRRLGEAGRKPFDYNKYIFFHKVS